jgi:DNA-binding HxlR family transcriptional regulator
MTETELRDKICPIVSAAKLWGSVWSLVVISYLMDGPMGFNELLRQIPGLNSKTLSRTLKSLQAKGLVTREVVSLQPFAVRYSLTPAAMELKPVVDGMRRWGYKWALQHRPSNKPRRCNALTHLQDAEI